MPARRGLQRTARAATRHGARDPLVRPQVDQNFKKGTNRTFDSPFLLRQGEPGTSQYQSCCGGLRSLKGSTINDLGGGGGEKNSKKEIFSSVNFVSWV